MWLGDWRGLVIGGIQWQERLGERRWWVKGVRVTSLGDWRYRYIIMPLVFTNTVIKTSLYLEDILHILDLPQIDHNTWDCLHWTGFCPRFLKLVIKNLSIVGECFLSSWPYWYWLLFLTLSHLNWILLQVPKNI